MMLFILNYAISKDISRNNNTIMIMQMNLMDKLGFTSELNKTSSYVIINGNDADNTEKFNAKKFQHF
jgi:hypothetical protein